MVNFVANLYQSVCQKLSKCGLTKLLQKYKGEIFLAHSVDYAQWVTQWDFVSKRMFRANTQLIHVH